MKKILIGLCALLFLTGCGAKGEVLDMKKVETSLTSLTREVEGKTEEMFKSNQMMDNELLKNKYGIDTTVFEEFRISMPTLLESANMYIVVKPKEGKTEEAKKETDKLMQKYEAQWSLGYAPKEESKVKNRTEENYSGYLIYIVSDSNSQVLETIKNSK